ncbi:MAG: diacylglycerol/lipid kinase family protein [Porcipelethomonas sp.]
MNKLYFIFNLQSGRATIGPKLAFVIDEFTKAGYEVTARPTQARMDACEAAMYACEQGFNIIVCSGGDGTLNEVIQGVMMADRKVPIGYIPTGSTNDFARGIGIPRTIPAAVSCIMEGFPFKCDIGGFGEKYFTYIAAFGAFVDVTYETSQKAKNILGHLAYLINGITKISGIKSYHMRITTDDEVIEDDFIFGMVTNSSSVAGLLSLGNFLFDDGLYEVTLIKTPSNIIDLNRTVHSLLNIEIDLDTAHIKSFRTSKIRFECDEEIPWTIDGECGGNLSSINIVNNRQAIEIITKGVLSGDE